MAARAFQPGSSIGCRITRRWRRASTARAGDGRPGADRRLGRSRARVALDHRARDGRLVRSLRAAEAGRAGDPDGPDRHADRDAGAARRCCWSAAASAMPCCSRSARRCAAAGSQVLYFAGYKKIDRPLQGRGDREGRRSSWCGAATRRPGFTPTAPQDRAFVGNIVAGDGGLWHAASWGEPRFRSSEVDRLIAIGSDGMMARGGARRGTACSRRYLKPGHHAIGSINSPMQCMMKEICAQCLQLQRDPVDRRGDGGLLLLQPGPAARPRRLPACCMSASAQNNVQEKLTKLWIDRCLTHLAAQSPAED